MVLKTAPFLPALLYLQPESVSPFGDPRLLKPQPREEIFNT